jgi:hypothetical protein
MHLKQAYLLSKKWGAPQFVYATNFGRISRLTSDKDDLGEISDIKNIDNCEKNEM